MALSEAYTENTTVPSAPEKIVDKRGRSYSYWRLRILYASILGYAAFYLVRQNFSMAMLSMSEEFNYTREHLGWILTAFSIIYGLGKFINGYISDRSNARYFITVGLMGSAILSVIVGYSSAIWVIGGLWALNGWFQSMGWPPCARMLTHWFSPRELGTKWSIWSSSHQIGSASIAFLGGILIVQYGWRWAFFIPGLIAAVMALFVFDRLRDNPKELGFPPVEEYKGDVSHKLKDTGERLTFKEAWQNVFSNKFVWLVCMANVCLYIPRLGVMNWAPMFLKEFKGVDLIVAGSQVAIYDIAGLVGGVTAGWISDHYFKGRRGPVATTYLLFLAVSLYALWKIPGGHPWFDSLCLMCAGFLVSGPQVLAGIALADVATKQAVGLATGLMGLMSYLVGATISSAALGKIVDQWGWDAGFILFIISALIGAFCFALTWNIRAKVLETDTVKKPA